MTARIPAALRVLARKPPYLLAMAGAGLLLSLLLAVLLGLALLVASLLPQSWNLGGVAVGVAVALFVPVAAVALTFLGASVRAYTVLTTRPAHSAAGTVGAFGGLGLYLLARRVRIRRTPFTWVTDPWGAAAGAVVQRALPPDHALNALLQVAGLTPRRPPTRGTGWMWLGLVLTGLALGLAAGQAEPGLGVALLAVLGPFAVLAAVLAAGVKGVLAGAWDRYLMDQVAAETEQVVGGVADAVDRLRGRPGPLP